MRVAVFAGSSPGPAVHAEAATQFGRDLGLAGIGIVYGGARTGIMGAVADAVLQAGAEVIGVIPDHMMDNEVPHHGLTRLEVVGTMHERKARMADLADAFAALPGGAGTLEELFEAWTWGNIGLHDKPVAVINVVGFWDPLIEQVRLTTAAGYLRDAQAAALGVVTSAQEFLRFVAAYQPPPAIGRQRPDPANPVQPA